MILRTIDAHTAGEPLRLVTEGWAAPKGKTILEKRAWAREHQDDLRRALMFEPRGHADMYGAVLTEPERPDSDAGVLFMHNEGFSTMCGHGVIAVTTIMIEKGLWTSDALNGDRFEARINLDAPAGQIRVRAEGARTGAGIRVTRGSFVTVPSVVLAAAVPVRIGARSFQVDVAFGGAFYAIVDAEAAGLPVTSGQLTELREMGAAIKKAVESAIAVAHPEIAG